MDSLMISDYHVHSEHSGDCSAPMKAMIDSAINKGLEYICFTEHLDFDYPHIDDLPDGAFLLDGDSYREDYLEAVKYAGDRIHVGFGVEMGMQPQVVADNEAFVRKYPFDFVIGSNHLCHHEDPYYPDYYEGRRPEQAVRDFFECTLENIGLFQDYDVLGHLDYIVRYVPGDFEYNWRDYQDVIDEILRTLVKEDKGLDVNTKSLQGNLNGEPNPCTGIISRFHELGGRIITFGSDAHKPEHVAFGFDRVIECARQAGFDAYCTFQERKPQFHKL